MRPPRRSLPPRPPTTRKRKNKSDPSEKKTCVSGMPNTQVFFVFPSTDVYIAAIRAPSRSGVSSRNSQPGSAISSAVSMREGKSG